MHRPRSFHYYVRLVLASVVGARYLVSLGFVLLLLMVDAFAILARQPIRVTEEPTWLDLSGRTWLRMVLSVVYLLTFAGISAGWDWLVGWLGEKRGDALSLRTLHRQTDCTGLHLLDMVLLLLLLGGAGLAYRTFVSRANSDVVIMLASVVGLPILLDLLPATQRRKRIAVRQGDTLRKVAERVALGRDRYPAETGSTATAEVERVMATLSDYNQWETEAPEYAFKPGVSDGNKELPLGMVIEIPPNPSEMYTVGTRTSSA